jgi:hypothetical protein
VDLQVAIELWHSHSRSRALLTKLVLTVLSGSNEQDDRLIDSELDLALDRLILPIVEQLKEVARVNLDADAVCICLIEGFAHAALIVMVQSAVLHQLDAAIGENRAAL